MVSRIGAAVVVHTTVPVVVPGCHPAADRQLQLLDGAMAARRGRLVVARQILAPRGGSADRGCRQYKMRAVGVVRIALQRTSNSGCVLRPLCPRRAEANAARRYCRRASVQVNPGIQIFAVVGECCGVMIPGAGAEHCHPNMLTKARPAWRFRSS